VKERDYIRMYQEVSKMIRERTQLHDNDPRLSDYWKRIVKAFGENEQVMDRNPQYLF
jgi:hypothetical protein